MKSLTGILIAYICVFTTQIGIAMGEHTATTTTEDTDQTTKTTTTTLAPFLIRLHLIRHGETHANIQNIVLGQGDSPLTDGGVDIACVASASHINGKSTTLKYWRSSYCSDLGRAHRTARIVLGLEDGNENIIIRDKSEDVNLIVDARLRELAKGAREGYSKEYSNEEAMALRRREATQSNNGVEVDVPKLESLANAMERVNDWIIDIIEEAANDYYATTTATTDISSSSDECDETVDPKVYHVFALSHSALIRTIIHDKVNHQLPTDYALTKEGSLRIQNLSRTILDVRPHKSNHSRFVPSLVKLTDVSHLNTATNNGPPYL